MPKQSVYAYFYSDLLLIISKRMSNTEAYHLTTLIHFSTKECQPCKLSVSIVKKVVDSFNQAIGINIIDVAEHMHLANSFQVRSVPTLILIHKNKEIWRYSGTLLEEELQAVLSAKIDLIN